VIIKISIVFAEQSRGHRRHFGVCRSAISGFAWPWIVEIAAEFPISIDNNALQVIPDYRLRGGISVHF
jgi:hypothetical protein